MNKYNINISINHIASILQDPALITLPTDDGDNEDWNAKIAEAKKAKAEGTDFSYDERDVILYSKSISTSPT